MKILNLISMCNTGPACRQCAYFQNDPATIEDAYPGLTIMSSGFASVRDRDGMLALSIADRDAAVTEDSCDPFEEDGGHVEIGEILIERGWRTWDYTRPSLPWSLARPYWRL